MCRYTSVCLIHALQDMATNFYETSCVTSGLDIRPLAARARWARSFKILRALTKFLRAR